MKRATHSRSVSVTPAAGDSEAVIGINPAPVLYHTPTVLSRFGLAQVGSRVASGMFLSGTRPVACHS